MIEEKLSAGKEASYKLMNASTEEKNAALDELKKALLERMPEILQENKKDLEEGRKSGLSEALLDRLALSEERVKEIADSLQAVIDFSDPVGKILEERELHNGLKLRKVSVPIGLIGVIYEARPNVTVDTAALCIKAGNAVILKGDETAFYSNSILTGIISSAVGKAGLPKESVQSLDPRSKEEVLEMLKATDEMNLIIPRGGLGLMKFMKENSQVPYLAAGAGICHTFVDKEADLEKAVAIVVNAKCQRPSICNALETLIVHEEIAEEFLPKLEEKLLEKNCEIRADEKALKFLKQGNAKAATEEDWSTEYLDYILAIKTVSSVEEAIEHIRKYGTMHSEAIISEDKNAIQKFFKGVDAAAVYSNASTRFTDGGEFGLGMEIGISTGKLHARGPLGVNELTCYKYLIEGDGQIRE